METMTDQASREAFESLVRYNEWFNPTPASGGKYYDTETQAAYETYQAALTHANTEMEKMRETLRVAVIEEVADEYHKELAAFYEHMANEERLPGLSESYYNMAKPHKTYADEIRKQVWKTQSPSEIVSFRKIAQEKKSKRALPPTPKAEG